MRRITMLAVFALAVLAYPVATSTAGPHGGPKGTKCVANTHLKAGNEVPPTDSNASGRTQIKVRNGGTIEFKTEIKNPDGENFSAGHIHEAPAGVNGPVVQPIFVGGPTTAHHIKQHGKVSNPSLGDEICANPAGFYVNYHSSEHPGGTIRGQLG